MRAAEVLAGLIKLAEEELEMLREAIGPLKKRKATLERKIRRLRAEHRLAVEREKASG